MSANAKWTFMVYMAGDNSLSSAGDDDLAEMRKAGSTPDVNVVVQFDNVGAEGTRRFRVLKSGNDLLQALGKTDSGDPNVLVDFITWARSAYPADRYALILWNHGGGWEPSALDTVAQEVKSRGYSDRESVERSGSALRRAFFRTTVAAVMGLSTAQERAICSDDGSGHSLDTVELGKVLARAKEILGQPVDVLGMDACLMSNLEVAYQVRPYVKYIVASEESEPNQGWPYDAVLGSLVATPDQPTVDLAGYVVDAYVKSYIDMHYTGDVTQAALDMSQMDALTTALDHFADALCSRLPGFSSQTWKAQRKAKRFWHNTMADIGSFCSQMQLATRNVPIREAAGEVTGALQPGAGRFVVAEGHKGAGVGACTGATIYLPSALTGISCFYKDLDFAKKQQWPKMIQAYVDA